MARKSEFTILIFLLIILSCKNSEKQVATSVIEELKLKSGPVVSCGPAEQKLGTVDFAVSCGEKIQPDFNHGLQLLHSFEYDEAEKVFARIIEQQPDCAMAYWGVAMSNFHPLWAPPTEGELKKGSKSVALAIRLAKDTVEIDFINAIAGFYKDWDKKDHRSRCLDFELAMEKLHVKYKDKKEATVFYALALNAAIDPADKTFTKQKKAGAILEALYKQFPDHPGIVHYIIHTYDYPELAHLALPAARQYASVAPSSAHALHMPSHVFTRMGLWQEEIASNLASVASAKCYAEAAGMKGHWDEELHGLDYLVYGYLQSGASEKAKEQLHYLQSIREIYPINFKVAYALAAIPARYALETKNWTEAARLKVHYQNFPWESFPWQKAIIHFARLMGAARTNNLPEAKTELKELYALHKQLTEQKDAYKANQVAIQIKTGEAWIMLQEHNHDKAVQVMHGAADLEDKTEKHPVTPGEVIPARELLGDMLLQVGQPEKAFQAYTSNLAKHPNRFNGLYGAALAAERSGQTDTAAFYYHQLISIADSSRRMEIRNAKNFIAKNKTVAPQAAYK